MLRETKMIPKTDLHMHSQFSPCSVNTNIADNVKIAKLKGLKVIAITDHGTTKYPKWFNSYIKEIERVQASEESIRVLKGMEVDVTINGELIVDNKILKQLDVVIAALHTWPGLMGDPLYKWWYKVLSKVINEGHAWIIAHPTDIAWNKIEPPIELCLEIIDLAKENDIVIELNYHHKDPNDMFLKLCIERGVKITPTSDAHKLEEIGHFEWYTFRVNSVGYSIKDVNWLTVEELLKRIE